MDSHPQRLTISSEADLSVEARTIRAQQRLKGDLENRPLSQFTLQVPEGIVGPLQVELTIDGRAVRGLTLSDDRALGITPVDPQRRHLQFANPLRPGKFTLQLSYQQAWSPETEQGPGRQRVVVPLVTPLSGQWREGRLNLTTKDGFSARLAGNETWRPLADDAGRGSEAPQRFHAAQPASTATLDILWGAPVVHRMWLDSWLLPDKRIDRLVCHFTSDRHPLRVQIPAGAKYPLQATLDGMPLSQANITDDRLQVPPSAAARTLELRYEVPTDSAAWKEQIDPARPTDDAWVRETYWQIVLPENRHLLWSPADVQREFSWQWRSWGWGRENHTIPKALASGPEQEVPRGANTYLFSTLGSPPAVRMATVNRTWLVLSASGIAFLLGGLMLKLPALRRREVLFAAAVLLAAVGLLYPEPLVLVAQAATLGVVAVVVVLAWKKLVSIYRPLLKDAWGRSALGSSGALRSSSARGSSAPTRLAPHRSGGSVGSSRAATIASQQAAAPQPAPAAAESASGGSSRPAGSVATSQGT